MRISRYKGTVKSYKAVTRNRVQIELKNIQSIFELFIDQSWVLNRGDSIVLAGTEDETGKICCYAYKNFSTQIKGWNYDENLDIHKVLILFSLVFVVIGLFVFPPFLLVIFMTFSSIKDLKKSKITNKIYRTALDLVER